MEPILKDLPS